MFTMQNPVPCGWLNKKRDIDTASRLIPITDDLTVLVAELGVKRK